MKYEKSKIFLIICTFCIIISIIIAYFFSLPIKRIDSKIGQIDQEIKMSMQYAQITEENKDKYERVENTDFVRFSTYFTRDLNNDGIAEKMLGTCRSLNQKDVLFMDLNVLSNGYLKDGKITINSSNFKYNMNMIKDSVLKNNYIKSDVKEIELNNVQNGTQKLILGDVVSNIGNNINNYSNKTYITLTGTHVADDSEHTETQISKTIELTVDWHGEVISALDTYTNYYNYDTLDTKTISFGFTTRETHYKSEEQLILKDNVSRVTIPELNGYSPEDVRCTNNDVKFEYNKDTKELTVTKESKVSEDGTVINSLSRNNSYTIEVTYPQEAYDNITTYTTLKVPINTYYEGYNNNSEQEEFDNPIKSNVPEGVVTLIFRETPPPSQPTGFIYNFYVNIMDKNYVSKPYRRYVISKQDILNLYDSDEEIKNKEYIIQWQAVRGNLGEVSSMIMSEPKAESYGDTWQNSIENKIMEEYTINTGIYFSGANDMLGDDGTITVYNNDTNELIKTFTKSEWQNLSKENPFKYETKIKHIRVETDRANANSNFCVYNIKELDVEKVMQDFTKEQIKEVDKVYTYLQGICNIGGEEQGKVAKEDYAYFVSEKSYTRMELEKRKMSTQETLKQEKIYIDAKQTQIGDSKWKNGIFLVEVPEEIINIEINSIQTNNQNVIIQAYDLFEQNGKYLLKILTENSSPEEFRITIDCNLTANPTVKTKDVEFKLYAVNKYCNDYYYEIQDLYDIDGDNITEEQIGTALNDGYTTMQLISPTNLITLETISNYDDEIENEETIAPNVALIESKKKDATINIKATNNYPYEVCDVKIIGKLPFVDNKYIINGKNMNSEFDAKLDESGISLPEELNGKATIYYSEKENPSLSLEDSENGWTTIVEDYTKIKSYLIDLNDYEMPIGKELSFNYKIKIPDDVSLNQAAFSNHAIYFSLKTEGGKLSLATEPNKVGLRIVKIFDLELTKYKKNSSFTIPGVTYTLKYNEKDIEVLGKTNEITRILTTDNNGKINLNNLFAEKEYKLKEIIVPDTCELNDEEIEFVVNADNTITVLSQGNTSIKNEIVYVNDTVKIDLEDEVKFDLEINKTKIGSAIPIDNVRFKIQDENGKKQFVRTVNGIVEVKGLSFNKEYTLKEISAPGNIEINNGVFTFKLVRETDEIKLKTIGENTLTTGTDMVEDLIDKITPKFKVYVQDEIRYKLNLEKQDKGDSQIKVESVNFKITGKGFDGNGATFKTLNTGKIPISGLHVGEEYTLEEIKAEGYYLDKTKDNSIKFKVERIEGNLKITKWDKGEGVDEVGEKRLIESSTDLNAEINLVLQNEKIPTYSLNIVKENEEGARLQGAQFKLTSKDDEKSYIATTNEQGIANFDGLYEYIDDKSFMTGKYILEEIYAPQGYVVAEKKLEFKASKNNEGKLEIEIYDGDSIIKEINGEKQISSDENGITLTIVNKPTFKLKKTGDEGKLLPNAKFIITDLNGNPVTGTDGTIIGASKDKKRIPVKLEGTGDYPWEKNSKQIWTSKNQGKHNTTSILTSNNFTLDRKMVLSFEWSVSSEGVYWDYAWYEITNVNTNIVVNYGTKIGGTDYGTREEKLRYKHEEIVLESGTYKIEFKYKKNGGGTKGTDTAYVKNLFIGDKVDVNDCIIETNEDGEISGNIPQGLYKAVEVEAPEGYDLPENEENRTYYFGISENKQEETILSVVWNKSISSDRIVSLKDVVNTSNGDFIAVGTIGENTNLNGNEENNLQGNGKTDGLVIKYDSDGNIIWSRVIGGDQNESLLSIAKDPQNGYVVVGYTESNEVYFTGVNEPINTEYFGSKDGLIVKINEDGSYNWSKTIGGVGEDRINDVTISDNREIAVVGSYLSSDMYLNGDRNDLSSTITHSRKNGTNISPTDTKNAFISVYSSDGDYIWSQNITGDTQPLIKNRWHTVENEVWVSSVINTESGFIVTANCIGNVYFDTEKNGINKITTTSEWPRGVVIQYTNDGESVKYQEITGWCELSNVVKDRENNIIVIGGYNESITINNTTFNSHYDGFTSIAIKLSQNLEYQKAISFGTGFDTFYIDSACMTDDNSIILSGGYYERHASGMDLDGDGVNDIDKSEGKSDGVIIKLKDDNINNKFDVEWYDKIGGDSYDNIFGITDAGNGEFVIVGSFDSSSISTLNKENFASNTGYHDGLIAKFGTVVTEPEVPIAQNIEVENKLKEFKITTEIGENSDNERAGGTITGELVEGEENKKYVETVKYGYSNVNAIEIVPDDNYQVVKITVNDEEIPFVANEERKVTLPAEYFKNMAEDKHIIVTLEKDVTSLIVHHYLKDENGNYTTNKVFDDETVSGKVDLDYITNPKMDLEEYDLEKDSQGEYVIPENASGKFSEINEDVTYYYEVRKYTLTVNHYLEGTENKIVDSIIEENKKGSEYQTSKSDEALQDYNFVFVDGEEQGTLNEDKIVNYYYKKKEFTITTEIIPNSETNSIGGTITGEYTNNYPEENKVKFVETVKKNENATKEIVITPDFGYKVKQVVVESTKEDENKTSKVIYGENKDENAEIQAIESEEGKLTLTGFNLVTENKHIKVEFEGLENSIIVHHYLKEKNDLTTKKVADDEIIKVLVGQENQIKYKENLQDVRLARNSNGTDMLPKATINNETGIIEMTYYYEPDDVILTINHYFADSGEKMVEDEKIVSTPKVVQDENGYYTITEELSYTLEENENYKEICKDNYIVSVESSIKDNIEIVDILECTLKYKVNSEINYFYKVKEDCEYIVNYYYDGIIDESKTDRLSALTASIIDNYEDKNITGYKLEKARAVNKKGEEVEMPLVIKDDISKNIINVYYVKDNFNYKIKYFYNGKEDASKEKNISAEYGSIISTYPEENKERYVFYDVKTLNENYEETDLPLTVSEDENKNIINVYYTKLTRFKLKKQWNNIPETDVNNYRSTFKLKKTVNGITSDCRNDKGKILTKTIIGNGEAQFEDIISYEKINKIKYSVEEIKVEKTQDGGNTWQELTDDEYEFINNNSNNSTESLANKVKVGDYVNYNPASGAGEGLSLSSIEDFEGTSLNGTINSSDLNRWRVLNIENGEVQLIPVQTISQNVRLDGINGYINSEKALDEVSSIYGYGNGAESARSLKLEDIEKYFKFDKTTYYNGSFSYGDTHEYTEGQFIVNDQLVRAPQTMTQSIYTFGASQYRYSSDENEDANKVYTMLFQDINTNSTQYWLATSGIQIYSQQCYFSIQRVMYGSVETSSLYSSSGWENYSYGRVVPLVILEEDVDGEKDENGVWQLKDSSITENTLSKKYQIKKTWNINNPNNYKSTFTLMKTVDGVTEAVIDETGNSITKEITGNGTAIFKNLKPYENEKEITYSVVESKIEKTENNWQTSEEVNMDQFIVSHKQTDGYDDIIVNSLSNKFGLDINITEDTKNLPLEDIDFTISIKDEQNNEFIEENKTFTSGEDGYLLEIARELPIESENKTFTVTITQNNEKDGYKKIDEQVTFEVTSKLADDGNSYVLVPENKNVENTKGVEVEENRILVKLQNSYKAKYEVHYFYDDQENESLCESYDAKVRDIVENYVDKPEGMVFEKVKAFNEDKEEVDMPLTVRKDKETNIINVYYRTQYNITTKVNKHDEKYTDRVETNVAGGTISGEDLNIYENVLKGYNSTKDIKIVPDEDYEIASVKVNGVEKLQELTEKINEEDRSLTLTPSDGYFTDVQENIEVEVEFRKKTKITVKYLEKDSKEVLATEKVIEGLEGETFGRTDVKHIIDRVAVNNYKEATVTAVKHQGGSLDTEISGEIVDDVIKEAFAEIKEDETGKKYAEGSMFADEITLIYWYEKIPSGVWVRHVEIDEVGKVSGEKTELKPIEKLTFTENTKEVLREEFEGYVPVDCPRDMAPISDGIVQDGNIVAEKDENTVTVEYSAANTVEVWFFYEKEHKIITEVVPHKEIIDEEEKDVLGGTISKEYKLDEFGNVTDEELEYYEKVLHRGNSSKKIEIIPQDGYQIKEVKINDDILKLETLLKPDGSVTLEEEYIKDIKEDIAVKVEFEKIPAKVIVKYIDIDTNEEIIPSKTISGYVNDSYNEPRPIIEYYESAGTEPTNSVGLMTKDLITVTYYYHTNYWKITTEVEFHEETRDGSSVMVKGGTISGETETPYEFVIKGTSSTKQIVVTPENGYMIRNVSINGEEQEFTAEEDGTFELPLFENLQENKHIVVEFARIPAKVKVQYLEIIKQKDSQTGKEIEVEKEIAESNLIRGYVNDEYKTEAKAIEFYRLIGAKLPENKDGVMTKDEIIVKYYYERLTFNMKVEKEISKIMIDGKEQEITNNSMEKVTINYDSINEVKFEISYRIKVINTEQLSGKSILEEIVPKGFEFVLDENGKMWTKQDEQNDITKILGGTQYALETEEIKPGETKEYIVTLKWVPNILNQGTIINVAQIAETKNTPNYRETTLNDNISEAKIEIELNKIAETDTNNSKRNDEFDSKENKEVPQTGQTRAIYIVLGIMIAMSAAGVIAIAYKVRKDK